MIEIRGVTKESADYDSAIQNSTLLPVCAGVAVAYPDEITDLWISQVNKTLSFYALDLAVFSYGRSLAFSHKTSFTQEPDLNGIIYAYSTRGESVPLNQMLIESLTIPPSCKTKLAPLFLQTFRHDHFSSFLQENCTYVPTQVERQSYPFSPLLKDSIAANKMAAVSQPIRVTYPHRMLLDSFGDYRTHADRVFESKLELGLVLGFSAGIAQFETFIRDIEQMVAPEGDAEKFAQLRQYFRSFIDKRLDPGKEKQFSRAHLRLPSLFRKGPYGRFGTVGATSGLFTDELKKAPKIPLRYSISHRGTHLALVDVIPTLPRKPLNAYAQQLTGQPARYMYLIINSVDYGKRMFPDVPLISVTKELPIGITQYLPETKAFASLDQKHRLYSKRHLLGGFFINPIDDQLDFAKSADQIVQLVQRSAANNPAEFLSPELFSVDHDYLVKAHFSEELLAELKHFRDRNALHEAYSRKQNAPSLPGAQSKIPVAFENTDGHVVIKPSDSFDDSRFTHILKLPVDLNNSADDKEKAGLCALEFLGMFTASKLGLEVPRFGLLSWPSLIKELDIASRVGDISKEPAYLVERFDITADSATTYVLKEFQALMGEPDKFKTSQGMPHTAESVCAALRRYSTDFDSDKYKLLRFFVANEIIGNTDMHLKNIAMLEVRDIDKNIVTCRLSPSYDIASVDALNSTFFLNSNDVTLAKGLTYNGKVRPAVKDWVELAESCLDIDGEKCLKLIDDIAERASRFVQTYEHRHVSAVFTQNKLLRDQYSRAMRRLSMGVKILRDRGASRDGDHVPHEEFKAVWNKSFEDAQKEESKSATNFNGTLRDSQSVNRSVNVADTVLAALLLPENAGRHLDGRTYEPGGSDQVMISEFYNQTQSPPTEKSSEYEFPDITDLPDFLRG